MPTWSGAARCRTGRCPGTSSPTAESAPTATACSPARAASASGTRTARASASGQTCAAAVSVCNSGSASSPSARSPSARARRANRPSSPPGSSVARCALAHGCPPHLCSVPTTGTTTTATATPIASWRRRASWSLSRQTVRTVPGASSTTAGRRAVTSQACGTAGTSASATWPPSRKRSPTPGRARASGSGRCSRPRSGQTRCASGATGGVSTRVSPMCSRSSIATRAVCANGATA